MNIGRFKRYCFPLMRKTTLHITRKGKPLNTLVFLPTSLILYESIFPCFLVVNFLGGRNHRAWAKLLMQNKTTVPG